MTQVHKNHLLLAWEEKNETESFDITKKLVFSLMIGFSTALFSSGLTAFAVPYDSGAWLSEGDYRYVDNGDDTVKIRYVGNDENVKVPSEINGKSVKALDKYAFRKPESKVLSFRRV